METAEPLPTPASECAPATVADAVVVEETDTAHGKANKGQHNAIFCAWLCRVFGHDYLRSRKGIADVAGGQGYLSYELGVRYGIPSTVIDPRPSASQKLNGMLTRRMKRITKNRLKEKQRKLCYSCIEVAGDSAKPDNGSSSVKEELSNTIDAIEAKPGVRLSDALSSESWTDILFSGDPTEGNTEIPVDQEVPMVLESIEHPLSVVGSNSNEISANDSKTESSDNAVAPSAGSAAALDDRNPLFQFLATSPIFRTAVYSAIGRPCPEVAELGTDSALDPDPNVLPLDDLTVLPTVLDSCGLYRGSDISAGISISKNGVADSAKPVDSILEVAKRVVPSSHPPFFHYQSTFSASRGEDPYCDIVTGKITPVDKIVVKVKHNHRDGAEIENKPTNASDDTILKAVSCSDFSILVGMHSDQATEEIIDLALANDMAFAVVPCCVFPKLFSHRKIPVSIYRKLLNKKRTEYAEILQSRKRSLDEDGDESSSVVKHAEDLLGFVPVVTYDQFVMFLMLKSPRIQCIDLPFEGRNSVLYALPISE